MKRYTTICLLIISVISFTLGSCSDFLDKIPKDTLTDATVWNSPEAILSYLGKIYNQMQTEDLEYVYKDQASFLSQVTDEAVRSYTWGEINETVIPDGATWWGYNEVRDANTFLEKIVDAPIDENSRELYAAEVRFIRAFYYFSMVKRYGGVPLITENQVFTEDNLEELQVPRDKEQDIYDFIKDEIDDIVSILPESWDHSNRFRATRYSAYALKSRAMLYAASIATYSQVSMNGIIGIPATEKDFYWEEAKKASEAIMNSGRFQLYEEYSNKEENFQQLFLDKSNHSEALFTKAFSAPDKTHSFDFYNAPQSFKVDYGCATNPVVELVEAFEYTDGSDGTLKVNDANGNPVKYADPYTLFRDKDPRLLASIMTPFSLWQGDYLEIRKGIIDGDRIITASNLTDTYGSGSNQIAIVGKDGTLDINDPTKTGFYVKKFMHASERVPYNRSDTYWMVFRYAEILLNYAEACMELGKDQDKALTAINRIRSRAGIAPVTSLSLEKVRKERRVELALENHRWWDLRRWRIAADVMSNTQYHSLYPYLVWEEGKHPSEMNYIFRIEPAPKNPKTFLPKLYYNAISSSQIATNPNLEQNPGY